MPISVQVLLQSGQEEAALDSAVQERLQDSEALRAADEGVNAVLLAACMAETERLQTALQDATSRQAINTSSCESTLMHCTALHCLVCSHGHNHHFCVATLHPWLSH